MLASLRYLPAALCLAFGVVLLLPERAPAYLALGPQLGLTQRHFRVYDNFLDPAANDNMAADPSFPGRTGATLAIWKASVEWGSSAHGDGSGDPSQPILGSGAANFDASFQGSALGVGGPEDNVHAATTAASMGLVGFAEVGAGGGWRIRYYEDWGWNDGPAAIQPNEYDLQSVATHEYGHALGLGHTAVAGATMEATVALGSIDHRSLEADDVAGLQALYGSVLPTKPVIETVSLTGPTLQDVLITGVNFHPTDNTVWFTEKAPGGLGVPIKANAVPSGSNGTHISIPLPTGMGRGDVLVQIGPTGGANLSNAFPIDAEGPTPSSPVIAGITPRELPSLSPNNEASALITGTGFDLVTDVAIDGVSLIALPPQWAVLSPTEIEFAPPLQQSLGTVSIEVSGPLGSDTLQVEVVAPESPVLRIGNGNEQEQVFSFISTPIRMGATPGSIVFLGTSLSNEPLSIPPLLELDIGGAATPHLLGAYVVQPQGWTQVNVFFNLPFGTVLYWQIVEYDLSGPGMPLPKSNVGSTFFVF